MSTYGIDVGDMDLMAARTGRWLKSKVLGLMKTPPVYVPIGGLNGAVLLPVYTTRVQRRFMQASAEAIDLTTGG